MMQVLKIIKIYPSGTVEVFTSIYLLMHTSELQLFRVQVQLGGYIQT